MTNWRTWAEVWGMFRPGDTVALAGGAAQPSGALASLAEAPEQGRGLIFTGAWLPGVNDFDPTESVPEAQARVIFVGPGQRAGFEAGRIRFMPLHYRDFDRWLRGPAGLKGAILQVSAPDDGHVTPGIAWDFGAAMLASGAQVIAEVNPGMPAPPGAPRLPVDRFAALVEGGAALPRFETGAIPADLAAIAARIAARIAPGDTVQLGIGKAAAAVLEALRGHRGLGYHAGLVIDAMLPHLDAGTFSLGIATGTALGTPPLYARMWREEGIKWRSVDHTHDHATLSAIPRLKTINSAVEIDLFGQSNGEMLRGRQISGHGGSADFQRGARASAGGEAILALPATAGRGKTSRIKPLLAPISIASIPRADADVVVTEHGAAEVRWLDVDARAQALIGIAAPEFRDGLSNAWDEMRRNM